MSDFPWEAALAALGVLVPIGLALYEFAVVGRKRLGYRVQMDTTATDAVHSMYETTGALQQLRRAGDGEPLVAPSFVLLRIENDGATNIVPEDYSVLDDDKVGIRVHFPGRHVAGMVVTELSSDFLRPSFGPDSGLHVHDDVIELPKVPLNRGAHYKVLAALDHASDAEAESDPKVVGGIRGGVGTGAIRETSNHDRAPRRILALVFFLVLIVLGQLAVSQLTPRGSLECAQGRLTLTGSSAFREVGMKAAESYQRSCPRAKIDFAFSDSGSGLNSLTAAGKDRQDGHPEMIAFSDGKKRDNLPMLVPRPIALSLFSLVVNKGAQVQDLEPEQIRQIYAGEVGNWDRFGGANLPVRLVSREVASGTRQTLEKQLLGGAWEPPENSQDCESRAPGSPVSVVRCELPGTDEVIDTVTRTPGAIGYAEAGAARAAKDRGELFAARIGGQEPTADGANDGAYPFWETEYAYTYGEPQAHSLTASFLRYLTTQVGSDIIREQGSHVPCANLDEPLQCRPS
ncbi:substrate-binding domain-containing protein [Saccharopolyspora sp. NFXS83]|uniref:PstS family phosphate ABC transporter substrate-binding protein n=1 Tax=Saccharopolyspora sp. NFXS83 TaxID=2993560 RepID=UPI00224A907F|nr:substrate-binding domain-containing protein [Saccharopolyspora sp. NFXS83]MCX2729976.1 substrate-binding domain-containing protein [Saccharopolyspora sp. NFXS83]